jgi:hypothetical protein
MGTESTQTVALNKGHHIVFEYLQVLFHAKEHHIASWFRRENVTGYVQALVTR